MSKDNTFVEGFSIQSYMVDGKLLLTPTFLFNLMQEVAVTHVDHEGIGWDYLNQYRQFWALSRIDVEILRRPRWHESILISTWGKKHNFLIQPRDHQVTTLDGDVLVNATSNWIILDFDGKPQTLDTYEPLLKNNHELHAIERPASRLRQSVPAENLIFKPVVYSNIDMNRHANNAAYVTWVMDNFSHDFHQAHELTNLSINYLQQMHANDFYAIARKEIAPNQFLDSIYSQNENIEVCRVLTTWKEVQ